MATPRSVRWLFVVLAVAAVATGATLAILAGGEDEPTSPVRASSDVATRGGFRFHLIQGRCGYAVVRTATETIEPEAGEFCLVSVDVDYEGTEPGRLQPDCQYLVDAEGRRHDLRLDLVALEEDSLAAFEQEFSPGQEADDIAFYFDVPKETEPDSLELHSSCEGRGIRIPLELQGMTPAEE
jgi:hypothetical protein